MWRATSRATGRLPMVPWYVLPTSRDRHEDRNANKTEDGRRGRTAIPRPRSRPRQTHKRQSSETASQKNEATEATPETQKPRTTQAEPDGYATFGPDVGITSGTFLVHLSRQVAMVIPQSLVPVAPPHLCVHEHIRLYGWASVPGGPRRHVSLTINRNDEPGNSLGISGSREAWWEAVTT